MESKEVILQVPENESEDFLKSLATANINVEETDTINSFDGATLIEIVVTITPVLALALGKIIKSWLKGNRVVTILKDGKTFKGYDAEEIETILESNGQN